MVSLVFRLTALVFGLVLVLLGIVGLFLPFLQGILLILLGLSVMSLVSERAAMALAGLKTRLESWLRKRRGGAGAESEPAED